MIIFTQAVITGILVGGVYALFCTGLTLIFGVMKMTNFAHGEIVLAGMYLTYTFNVILRIHLVLSILLTVPVMYLFGHLLYYLLYKRVLAKSNLPQTVMTVALSLLIQTVFLIIFRSNLRTVNTPISASYFHLGPLVVNKAQLLLFFIALAVTALLSLYLNKTESGKAMRATVDDPDMALMVGINSNRIYALAVAIGIAIGGFAGAVDVISYPIFPTIGETWLPLGFVAIVLGGMGNIQGGFAGGLVIGVIQQLAAAYMPPDLQNAVVYFLFIIILLLRPSGLTQKEGIL